MGNGIGVSSKTMEIESNDVCPFCHQALKIVCVRFEFFSAKMVLACPNCASAIADDCRSGPKEPSGSPWRYFVAFALGALITAAALRHFIHIYGGFSRAEIGIGAAVLFIIVLSFSLLVKPGRH